ncbi:unnamed protein product [Caenorhabditis brenneri]
MLEQTIPVIGVPVVAPKASLATPRLVQPTRIISEEVKNAEKNTKKAAKVKEPPKPVETAKPVEPKQNPNPNQPKNALKFPPELITETGRPARENGEYVKEEGKKLSTGEKAVMEAYIKSRLNSLKNHGLTDKQMKKNGFKLRLVWLLNKKLMLDKHDETVKAKKKATEAKIKAKRDLQAEKRLKAAQQSESQEAKPKNTDIIKPKHLNPPKVTKPNSLMDMVFPHPTQEDNYNNVSPSYPTQSESTTGYQYLDDNWINSETWGSSCATSSDFTSSYLNSSTLHPTNSYTYPVPSSTLSTSSYQMPTSNSYSLSSSMNYPADQTYSQLSTSSDFNTMPSSFNAPPPSFAPVMNESNSLNDLSSLTVSAAPTDFVSSYRQEFPLQTQPLPDINPSVVTNQYSFSQQDTQTFSTPSYDIPGAGGILEATEEELAKQRRLLEIEEELKAINFKKMQMQMEAELREREMQLAYRQQMMEYREREIRDREMMQDRGYSSRDRYEDYDRSSRHDDRSSRHDDRSSRHDGRSSRHDDRSSRHDDRSRSRRQDSGRSSENHRQQKQQQPQHNSTSSSNSRQINIERADDRRGGRNNEGKRGGEGSLKRPAERGGSREDNGNRSGRIQPAVPTKRPRSRRPKGVHADIQMQEISDED